MFSQRVIIVSTVVAVLCLILLLSTTLNHEIALPRLESALSQEQDRLSVPNPLSAAFQTIKHPIKATKYIDPSAQEFEIASDGPWWHEPLRNKILILDIDTRIPQGPNEVWNDGRMEWEAIKLTRKGSAASASFLNHFLYGELIAF